MPGRRRTARRKSIYDPVHGAIAVDGAALDLIGTPVFQRLWGIRQTGFAHLVFPGANHTRLEHSLGVFSVAERLARSIGLDDPEAEEIAIGGLLHDLGHSPYSHTFDPTMDEVLGATHEAVSRDFVLGRREVGATGPTVPEVLERHGLSPNRIAELIDPSAERPTGRGPLLHGAVDADRIDYLQRDAHYTGVAHGVIDAHRILETARWRQGRLCFAEKGRAAIEGFLVGRALMYASVYYHKTVRAAEVMAQSAVERLSGYPEVARPLLQLNDGQLLDELAARSERSRSVAEGLLYRKLYKHVGSLRAIDAADRRRWEKAASNPQLRRAMEDRMSERLRLPPLSILLDLAGVREDPEATREWEAVALEENGRLTYPFRSGAIWPTLLRRPPSLWAVSVYADPRFASVPASRVDRALRDA